MADVEEELQRIGAILERAHGVRHPVMDIEFKVEEGRIFLGSAPRYEER
jgi:hypothetical protein